MRFAGSGQTLQESRAQLDRQRPNIVVVDRSFGMHPILEWINQSRQQLPEMEIVVWATSISDVECFRALQAGARGILRKTASIPALFHCLRTVARKDLWTENLFISKDQQLGRPRNRPLTPREQQVAALVAKGMKNREIAETLSIATGTVKIHLMHIFEKTDIRDRFELALQGLRLATKREGEHEEALAETILAPLEG
jgi:DNA-binding NarL/FixJ family response regulator